jgi:hypothetical protein
LPRGTYLVIGRPQALSCAPGPAGWRYVSDRLDLAVDADFTVVRFQVRDGHEGTAWARGGRKSMDDGLRVLTWTYSADPVHERVSTAMSLDAESPGSLVALLRAVGRPGETPLGRRVGVVRFTPPSFAGLEARYGIARREAERHDAPDGPLLVERWVVDDLDAGTRLTVHLAGDVVVAAEGSTASGEMHVEVRSLESPPTGTGATG